MKIIDILKKYDSPSSIKVGDTVLVEGLNNYGIYIILGKVVKIENGMADVEETEKYFISGRYVKGSGEIKSYHLKGLKESIKIRLIEQNEFIKWLVNKI
ncbi:MAG: hypothetical protein WD512_14075 [Candidatus Paceibacterota bacterium]